MDDFEEEKDILLFQNILVNIFIILRKETLEFK